MIEYIYFVKCMDCEDEPFDFFDEAKAFALSKLSTKPEIHQTEVVRNDFGECIDSTDYGKVWSWEEVMSDIPEDTDTTFSKSETFDCDNFDTEFDDNITFETDCVVNDSLLNETYYAVIEIEGKERRFPFKSRDDASEYLSYVRAGKEPAFKGKQIGSMYTESCRKPIPEGMTVEALVEEMEENEEMVECKRCHELFPKEDMLYELSRGYLCPICIMDLDAAGEDLEFRPREIPEKVVDETILTEAPEDYYFPWLDDITDAKLQILYILKRKLPSHFFKGEGLNTYYVNALYADYGTATKVQDFYVSDGRIMVEHAISGDSYTEDLEEAFKGLKRGCQAYTLFMAIRDAAKSLKPKAKEARNINVYKMLKENPALAKEFKNHITKIVYKIPLVDEHPEDFIDDKEANSLSSKAMENLNKIYNDFCELDFVHSSTVEYLEEIGVVKNRPASLDVNRNIENSWHAEGTIYFDCKIGELSEEACEIIAAAKVKSADEVVANFENKNYTDCYRLANMLIKYFDNDVLFYTKEHLAASFTHKDNNSLKESKKARPNSYDVFDDTISLYYNGLEATVCYNQTDADSWDEKDYLSYDFEYEISIDDFAEYIWDCCIDDESYLKFHQQYETLYENDDAWKAFVEENTEELMSRYQNQVFERYEDRAKKAFEEWAYNDFHEGYKKPAEESNDCDKSLLETLEESEDYKKRLMMCPECGDYSFDQETGICINCGFNAFD